MEEVFLFVLGLSYKSILIICMAIIGRLLIRKAPKIFSYVLWSAVFLRLVLPFGIRINVNMDYNKNVISKYMQSEKLQNTIENKQERISKESEIIKNTSSVNSQSNNNKGNSIVKTATFIWITGLFLIFTLSSISYLKIKKMLGRSVGIKDNIYISNDIDAAFVFGIIKPNIYLPHSFNEREIEYIIEHERIHIKRKDYIVKIIYFLISCIHWFNPLVWISFNLMESDMELSCDEMVINKMGLGMKKQYSTCLLNMATKSNKKSFCPVSFSEKKPEKRIRNVLNYKGKNRRIIFFVSSFIIIIMVLMFIEPSYNNIAITDKKSNGYASNNIIKDEKEYNKNQDEMQVESSIKQEGILYKLYFNDLNAEYLIPEERRIDSNDPEAIVYELIMGPKSEELSSCISKDIRIKSIDIKDKIAYVDFDKSIVGKVNGSCGETMFTYSIVNTLVLNERLNIKGVRFYIDGEIPDSIGGHLDHSGVIEANLSLIKK